jgi:hypothetical protein
LPQRNPVRRAVFTDSMTGGTTRSTTGRRAGARDVLAFGGLCALLVALAVAIAVPAGATNARVIGKTKQTPPPDCPKSPCSGIGKVTGFMMVADGKKRPFNVHKDGTIVAWALDLSRPTNKQQRFFASVFKSDKYGKTPTARLAVLKHKGHKKYKLVKQTPTVKLNSSLGRKEIFTLDKPLRVHKGQIVALTYPTWASNFATEISSSANQWRGSRRKTKCNTSRLSIAKQSRPQQKVASVRNYGCDYKGARLLYWAYYVPS